MASRPVKRETDLTDIIAENTLGDYYASFSFRVEGKLKFPYVNVRIVDERGEEENLISEIEFSFSTAIVS